jgi:hypothetical protein
MASQKGPPSLTRRSTPLDHVLGDGWLSDAESKLEQLAVDAWRTQKLVLRAHLPDQRRQFHLDSRAPFPRVRFPTPIATNNAGPMQPHERFGPDDCENLQDWRKPAAQPDKELAIMVREPDATMQPTLQDNQLMSKHRVVRFKPQLDLNGQDRQSEQNGPIIPPA